MKRFVYAILLIICVLDIVPTRTYAQNGYSLTASHYDLDLSFNFSEKTLDGTCHVIVNNNSDVPCDKISFILYRLMTIQSIKNEHGDEMNFTQGVVSFSDFKTMQANAITINETMAPRSTLHLTIKYNGYLLGYQEMMMYLKDKISPDFTLFRTDSYPYPVFTEPSYNCLRNIVFSKYSYVLNVTVPDSLVVANGGKLLSKSVAGGKATYKYESKKPNWRIDMAIAPYQQKEIDRLRLFSFPDDSAIAADLLDHGNRCMKFFSQRWGSLKNDNAVTIIETERGSGAQSDEIAILLPQEAFAPSNYKKMYHEMSHLWNVKITEKEGASPRWEEGLAMFCQEYAEEFLDTARKGAIVDAANNLMRYLKNAYDKDSAMYKMPMCEFGNNNRANYSYEQGMVMFSLLNKLLGDRAFDSVISAFYEKYYLTGASTQNFIDLWKANSESKNLDEFFDDWVYTPNYTKFILNENTFDDIVNYYAD